MDDRAALETLQAKALLLLRHEHELYNMRKARRRSAQWLESYRELSSELRDIDAPALIRRWAELHVTRLHFEVAGAIEYELDTGAVTFEWMDPGRAPVPRVIPGEVTEFFASQPAGVCRQDGIARTFGATIGLHAYFWNWSRTQSGRAFLAVAGCSQGGAPFNAPADDDRGLFGMLADHLGALLANSALVEEVTRDREQLKRTNSELDASLHQLAEAQRRLIESSRHAGMADIAIAVLHNVGNVLNSVNVSVETLVSRATNLRVGRLVEAADAIEQGDDQRRTKGLAYLRGVASALATDRESMLQELQSLRDHVDHVKAIVSRQQTFATVRCVVETCQVNDLIEDALLMSHAAIIQYSVDVIRDYQDTPRVILDRHRALQILINLVSNARQSVVEAGRPDKRIIVRSRRVGASHIRIEVEDNGLGIAPEHHARVFTHGFTTKKAGHGIGLHSSALAARELHGTLTFASEGVDRGATFALELPLVPR
jgi:two-component system, NtrC family, sensor kinase